MDWKGRETVETKNTESRKAKEKMDRNEEPGVKLLRFQVHQEQQRIKPYHNQMKTLQENESNRLAFRWLCDLEPIWVTVKVA